MVPCSGCRQACRVLYGTKSRTHTSCANVAGWCNGPNAFHRAQRHQPYPAAIADRSWHAKSQRSIFRACSCAHQDRPRRESMQPQCKYSSALKIRPRQPTRRLARGLPLDAAMLAPTLRGPVRTEPAAQSVGISLGQMRHVSHQAEIKSGLVTGPHADAPMCIGKRTRRAAASRRRSRAPA